MKYACYREQFNKGYRFFYNKPISNHLLEMALYCRSTTWAKAALAVVVTNFSFLVFFEPVLIFSFTYLWSARKDFSPALSAHCYQEISDLKVMFLNNMDLESRPKFSLSHYNWMLILIPFKPRRLVFLVFSVQTVAYPLQTPGEAGGGTRPIFGS